MGFAIESELAYSFNFDFPELRDEPQDAPSIEQAPFEPAKAMTADFYRCLRAGQTEVFNSILEDGLLEQATPQLNSALHIVARHGFHQLIEPILARRPSLLTQQNVNGDLALHLAARAGHETAVAKITELLVRANLGHLCETRNRDGDTALHLTLKHRRTWFPCRTLVTTHPNASFCLNTRGESPLFLAAELGLLRLVKIMTRASDFNAVQPSGKSIVYASIRGGNSGNKSSSKVVIGVITGVTAAVFIGVGFAICIVKAKMKKKKKKMVETPLDIASVVSDDFDPAESLLYDFDTLEAATNNFSDDSKIGQGGFGSVYKGTLPDGQEIAVKRLPTSSAQVVQELKNEVILVAKLQHRNLLRLLGFCLSYNEKLLVYEYAPNKSLDTFLFDPEKNRQRDWRIRYKIIAGVARGMLYLHEDSQLRIIHRDLKASNVLLDTNMNPKISDFGIAKIFSEDQTQGNTCRVIGTYGYMAPEYAMHGKFSAKSDVYSFGVLVLEIISGKRNSKDLLSYAWNLWSEGTPLEFVDETLRNSCSNNEVIRCIHLGLLCVQDDMVKRHSVAKIVLMLDSYSVNLPTPQQPALFIRRRTSGNVSTDKSTSKSVSLSVNDVTMTELDPR